jgi:hypothetical protein
MPEEARIRSYLQAQGAKLSPAEIVDKVRAAMAELRTAAEAVPAARFDASPAPDEWSANEVMAHVVDAGRHFGDQIVSILDGRSSEQSRERRDVERHTVAEWWTVLERDRAALFALVRAADPGARLEERIEHATFGPLNWREALLFMRLHDLDHVGQLRKIAAAFGERG